MSEAPEKLWMTAEEQGWPGSFRSFRLSDLEHPEEYPAYVRADLYEQAVKRAEAAQRLAGARVVTLEWRGTEGVWAKADALFGATYRIPASSISTVEVCAQTRRQASVNSGFPRPVTCTAIGRWPMRSDLIAKLAERLHDQGLTIYGEGKTKVGAAAIVDAAVATTLVLVAKEIRAALTEGKDE